MHKYNKEVYSNLRTGDIILFCSSYTGLYGIIDSTLKYFTNSQYTHIGFVIKEKKLGYKNLDINKTYLWESGYEPIPDPTDNKVKYGVQLTDLEKLLKKYKNGNIYVRKLNCSNEECARIFNFKKLEPIQHTVYGKPYDYNIFDWLLAIDRFDLNPQKIDRFWCSAFTGYILTKCDILRENTDWSILRPSDFSIEDKNKHLEYKTNIKFENKQYKLL